jgi:hypothetical protein
MRTDRIERPQGGGSPEATASVQQSREAAERLWAEIGQLLSHPWRLRATGARQRAA